MELVTQVEYKIYLFSTVYLLNTYAFSTQKFYWFWGYEHERETFPSFVEFMWHFGIELVS